MKNIITTEDLSRVKDKKKRARLIKMQKDIVKRDLNSHYFAWEPQTMKYTYPFDKKLNLVGLSNTFAKILRNIEIKWRITCYVLSREKNGKTKLTGEEYLIKTPCRHDEIAPRIADFHWEMIEEFRASIGGDCFITAGWIASGIELEHRNETAMEIFKIVGAWKLESDWEEAQRGGGINEK